MFYCYLVSCQILVVVISFFILPLGHRYLSFFIDSLKYDGYIRKKGKFQ